jgi:DNA-directed RNA polymerase specialized sigma24 family protein
MRDADAAEVRRAFRRLSTNCQQLLLLLLAEPAPSYSQISAALDMPVGSIGPTRARCLRTLRRLLDVEKALDG